MPDPITITPDPIELPRYIIYRLSDRVLQGGGGELVRPEAMWADPWVGRNREDRQ